MAEVLGTVASAIQLVDTALKAREYIKDFYNAPAEQRKLFTELDDLKPLLTELQKRVTASPLTTALQHMEVPLGGFKVMMDRFTVKFELPDGPLSNLSKQLSWTLWNKKEAKEYLQEFESMKSLLNTWLTLGIWDAGEKHDQEHKKDHNAILATVTEQGRTQQELDKVAEERHILDWITPLNFFQRQDDIFSAWQPGTGEWLLSDAQFTHWESGSGGILWCRGIPGAGKTVLSDTGVACLYLNHKEREVQTPTNLLGSILKQLVVDRSLPTAAYELYKHHRSRDTRPSLAEMFSLLQAIISPHSKSYIIVDALDEYPEEQCNVLLKHLSMLRGPTISLMVTSRPYVTLDDLFPDVSGLEIKATEDDIRRYVDKQIRKSPRLSKHVQTRPELHDEIKSEISSNADGMFLLAKLHTESLAAKNTIKAVREALQHLPQNLNHTYEEAMNRIKNQNEEDRQLAIQALIWVAYAKRPLSVAELCEALAIEPDATTLDADNLLDISIVLSVCAGLIIVDEAMSVVRLIHYTTQGYFDSIQPVQFADAHMMIASQCLAYLSFDEFFQLDISYMVHERVKAHPLAAYSQHFLLHAAEASRQLDLQPGLTSFLEKAHSWQVIWFNFFTVNPHAPGIIFFYGYTEMAELLVKKYGANVNCQGGFYGTALQAASVWGHESVARFLIEKGADVNAQGGEYGTALQAASHGGYELIARFLIEKGADVNAVGGPHGTALQAASCWSHECVAQFLIENGADVNAMGGHYGTALQAASCWGHESVAQFLVENGADVNVQGGHFGTALQAASYGGHELVAQFIEMGADVNAVGGYYGTALQAASYWGHEVVAQFLIENGADVNAQGGFYGTALQATSHQGHESLAQFLIAKGADVNAVGGVYGTVLQAASEEGHESVAQFLIEKGADVNAHGGKYGTALQAACACVRGQEPAKLVVQFLIKMGADVNAQEGKYGTALQAASHWGSETVAHLLIENGAHLDQTAKDTTALWEASAEGHEAVVQLFIESGANLNIQGHYGTALQAASVWGHESVVKLLIENGAQPVSPPERPRSVAGYIERQQRKEIYDGGLSVKYTC
ncbi:ankyrin repeat domain-containing protein [Mycena latifolia]|nr:ankyrin repeat domain-containing protein [Mycena latifolia]